MMPNKKVDEILRERMDLQIAIKKLENQILKLQGLCEHPRSITTPRSDTGNYSKSDDRYWYEHKCPDCDKRWETDQ